MFLNVCQKNFSHISLAHVPKSKRFFIVKSSTYCFHVKMKILADFYICVSLPLNVCQHWFSVTPWKMIIKKLFVIAFSNDGKWRIPIISQPAFTCSKLTIETLSKEWNMIKVNNKDIFIVNFEHISHLVLVFLLLTLNM